MFNKIVLSLTVALATSAALAGPKDASWPPLTGSPGPTVERPLPPTASTGVPAMWAHSR